MTKPVQLRPLSTDSEGSEVVIRLEGPSSEPYEARIPTMAAMSMIGALSHSVEEAGKHQLPGHYSIDLHRVQLVEGKEFLLVRMFVSADVSHEYRLPLRTDLAQTLLQALDALNASKTTHQGSDKPQ